MMGSTITTIGPAPWCRRARAALLAVAAVGGLVVFLVLLLSPPSGRPADPIDAIVAAADRGGAGAGAEAAKSVAVASAPMAPLATDAGAVQMPALAPDPAPPSPAVGQQNQAQGLAAGAAAAAVGPAAGAAAAMEQPEPSDPCVAMDAVELTAAIEDGACGTILLRNAARDAYALARPIRVARRVRVVGDPGALPHVDGGESERCFTVEAGGFLELQFLRLYQGSGVERPRRWGARKAQEEGDEEEEEAEGEEAGGVVEIRGGGVFVQAGALGARFLGVVFLAVQTSPEAAAAAMEATARGVGTRVWGGHVLVADGRVEFTACHFWDAAVLVPLTDQVLVGGDVLVLQGQARFDGCTFTQIALFGNSLTVGGMVALFGGEMYVSFCSFESFSVATSINGVGQSMFTGSGVMVMTGVSVLQLSVTYFSSGTADCFVGGGVLVYTGVTMENIFPLQASYGVGFYITVGGGVAIETGVAYIQYTGPSQTSIIGSGIFLGSGTAISVGVSHNYAFSTTVTAGGGGIFYLGAGYSLFLACPVNAFTAISAYWGLGAVVSQPAGLMVYLACPAFLPAAINYFVGSGGVMCVAAGAAVVGASPVFAPSFISYARGPPNRTAADYFIGDNPDGTGIGFYWRREAMSLPAVFSSLRDKGGVQELPWQQLQQQPVAEERPRLSVAMALQQSRALLRLGEPADATRAGARFVGQGLRVHHRLGQGELAALQPKLATWVPEPILKGGLGVAAMATAGEEGALGRQGGASRPLVEVDREDMEVCALCTTEGGVQPPDDVVGRGADQCTGEAAAARCAAALGPAGEGPLETEAGADAAFEWEDVDFNPWHLVFAELDISSAPGLQGRIDPADVRDGLRAVLGAGWGAADDGDGVGASAPSSSAPVALAVFPATPQSDPHLRHLVPFDSSSGGAGSDSDLSRLPLRAVLAFNAPGPAARMRTMLEDPGSQAHAAMLDSLREYLRNRKNGSAVDESTRLLAAYDRTVIVPAYNSPTFLQGRHAGRRLGVNEEEEEEETSGATNGVRLFDPRHPGPPLVHVRAGEAYGLQLTSWLPGTVVVVHVVGVGASSSSFVGREGAVRCGDMVDEQPLRLTVDGVGALSGSWTVPECIEEGYYYLRAEAVTDSAVSPFAMSPVFHVRPRGGEQRARRLRSYGPLVRL